MVQLAPGKASGAVLVIANLFLTMSPSRNRAPKWLVSQLLHPTKTSITFHILLGAQKVIKQSNWIAYKQTFDASDPQSKLASRTQHSWRTPCAKRLAQFYNLTKTSYFVSEYGFTNITFPRNMHILDYTEGFAKVSDKFIQLCVLMWPSKSEFLR